MIPHPPSGRARRRASLLGAAGVVALCIIAAASRIHDDTVTISRMSDEKYPLHVLPDTALIEAYRAIGFNRSASSQSLPLDLFLSILTRHGTPMYDYVEAEMTRSARIIESAFGVAEYSRLLEAVSSTDRARTAYVRARNEYARTFKSFYSAGNPSPGIGRAFTNVIREIEEAGLGEFAGPQHEALADYYFRVQRDDLALTELLRALECRERVSNYPCIAGLEGRIGIYFSRKGDLAQSERWLIASLQHARERGDPAYISRSLAFLAGLRAEQGHSDEAESLFVGSITEIEKAQDPVAKLSRLAEFASHHRDFGSTERSASLAEEARSLGEQCLANPSLSDHPQWRKTVEHYLAVAIWVASSAEISREDIESGTRHMREAAEMAKRSADRRFAVEIERSLGDAYAAAPGRDEEAARCYRKALAESRKLGERDLEARMCIALGTFYFDRGHTRKADEHFSKARRCAEGPNCLREKIEADHGLAGVKKAAGNTAAAEWLLAEAAQLFGRGAMEGRLSHRRGAMRQLAEEIRGELVELAFRRGCGPDSLLVLSEMERPSASGSPSVDPAAEKGGARSVDRDRIPEKTTIVRYIVAPGSLTIVGLDRAGEASFNAPIRKDSLENLVAAFSRLCAAGSAGEEQGQAGRPDDFGRRAASLYRMLIEPIDGLVDRSEALWIVADDPLGALPFAALKRPGEAGSFLAESKRIAICRDFGPLLRGSPPPRYEEAGRPFASSLLVVNPLLGACAGRRYPDLRDLSGSANESRLGPGVSVEQRLLTMGDAHKEAVLAALPAAEHVHFAAHIVPYAAQSGGAAILLSDPSGCGTEAPLEASRLSEDEIRALRLDRTRLVVLASCGVPSSEGRVSCGLPEAFLEAGARAVLAAPWPVEDRAAGRYMDAFYLALPRCGFDPAAAVQLVQKQYIETSRRASAGTVSPGIWTAFQVFARID